MFDYEAAHNEVARPAYDALNQNLRDLYQEVAETCTACNQDNNLDVIWRDDDLRQKFEAIPTLELSHAAKVVYYFGHWFPGGNPYPGAYWKFSGYADQVLRAKLELPRSDHSRGFHYEVHQGSLRVCLSTAHNWQWEEIGSATRGTLVKASLICPVGTQGLQTNRDFQDRYDKTIPALVALAPDTDLFKNIAVRYAQ